MRVLDFPATSAIGLNHLLPSTADVYQVGTRLCLAVMNPLMIAVESILACPPVPPPQLHVTSILKYNTLSWGWGARLAGNFASGYGSTNLYYIPKVFLKTGTRAMYLCTSDCVCVIACYICDLSEPNRPVVTASHFATPRTARSLLAAKLGNRQKQQSLHTTS